MVPCHTTLKYILSSTFFAFVYVSFNYIMCCTSNTSVASAAVSMHSGIAAVPPEPEVATVLLLVGAGGVVATVELVVGVVG